MTIALVVMSATAGPPAPAPTVVDVPTISPAGGTFPVLVVVEMDSGPAGGPIVYTLDDPTSESAVWTAYSSKLVLDSTQTVSAKASDKKETATSDVISTKYTVTPLPEGRTTVTTCHTGSDGVQASTQVALADFTEHALHGDFAAPCMICGDGFLGAGEECDDGNTASNDGCSATCNVETGYACSGGSHWSASTCASKCGDGVLAFDETCDDGSAGNGVCSADFVEYAPMYRGGRSEKKVESTLFLRYDAATSTLHAKVTVAAGVTGLKQDSGAWIKIADGQNNAPIMGAGVSSNFKWIGEDAAGNVQGWEDSVEFAATCVKFTAHLQVFDDGASQSSSTDRFTNTAGIDLCVDCSIVDGCDQTCVPATDLGFTCSEPNTKCVIDHVNSVVDYGEECDDGNLVDGDGCSSINSIEHGWARDASGALVVVKGDGIVVVGSEDCDDQNTIAADGCTEGKVDDYFTCAAAGAACLPIPNDGHVVGTEECDDKNTKSDDGCFAGKVASGYQCSGEPSACTVIANDGLVRGTDEECDDGNTESGDGCFAGKVASGYQCSGEPSACTAIANDGLVVGDEQCDDGNTKSGDGCFAGKVASGYQCSGEPSACAAIANDGLVVGDEKCDDGNTESGDGCFAGEVEADLGFSCPVAGAPCVAAQCGDGIVAGTEECDSEDEDCDDQCRLKICPQVEVESLDICNIKGDLLETATVTSGFEPESWEMTLQPNGNYLNGACGATSKSDAAMKICYPTSKSDPTTWGWAAVRENVWSSWYGTTKCAQSADAGCVDGTVVAGWSCPADGSSPCSPIHGDGFVVGNEECDEGSDDSKRFTGRCVNGVTVAEPAKVTFCHKPDQNGGTTISTNWNAWNNAHGPNTNGHKFVDYLGSCHTAGCGDGLKEDDEGCDDGNLVDGDGCSATCGVEAGFTCQGGNRFAKDTCHDNNDQARVGYRSHPDAYIIGPDVACGAHGATNPRAGVREGTTVTGCVDVCGNGIVDANEQCDDDSDACDACMLKPGYGSNGKAVVGDKVVAGDEQCDDGNTESGDGCDATGSQETGFDCPPKGGACVPKYDDTNIVDGEDCADGTGNQPGDGCFNGKIEAGYKCSAGAGKACEVVIGDGIVIGDEQCDDGNTKSGDGCDDTGSQETGFTCPPKGGACAPVYDDKLIVAGEDCADETGNQPGDGCFNGKIEPGYECPQEGPCVPVVVIGDGIVVAGVEECDDNNKASGDGCSDCGRIENGYQANLAATSVSAIRGDGIVVGDEQCDDANLVSGDGCDSTGRLESGYKCPDAGQSCVVVHGDGLIRGAEACDDGNTVSGDGCSSVGTVEFGFACATPNTPCKAICGDGYVLGDEQCDEGTSDRALGNCVSCMNSPFPSNKVAVCHKPDSPAQGTIVIAMAGWINGHSKGHGGNTPADYLGACVVCGDGFRDNNDAANRHEQCDDGNLVDGDGCSATCGVEAGWVCEHGSTYNKDVCRPVYADSKVNKVAGEVCDDNNLVAGDGCNEFGNVELGYTCDDAEPSVCTATASDGRVRCAITDATGDCVTGETCDAASTSAPCTPVAERGCAPLPAPVCGDGWLAAGEQCDSVANCNADCTAAEFFTCSNNVCRPTPGDGNIVGTEDCDDANLNNDDGCSNTGSVASGYTCSGAPSTCEEIVVFNNGQLEGSEACDDGGKSGGCVDGEVQLGWSCAAANVACVPDTTDDMLVGDEQCFPTDAHCVNGQWVSTPGNGIVEGEEECDDGNTARNDGCGPTMRREAGFYCSNGDDSCSSGFVTRCDDGVVAGDEECDRPSIFCSADCKKLSPVGVVTGCSCSGHGTCDITPGVCNCKANYFGADCSTYQSPSASANQAVAPSSGGSLSSGTTTLLSASAGFVSSDSKDICSADYVEFAQMYRAGKPEKKVESTLFLRYDAATEKLHAKVTVAAGVTGLKQPSGAWIKIDGTNGNLVEGSSQSFNWIPSTDGTTVHVNGWEASASMPRGVFRMIAHLQVFDDGASQTSSTDRFTNTAGIEMSTVCGGEVVMSADVYPADESVLAGSDVQFVGGDVVEFGPSGLQFSANAQPEIQLNYDANAAVNAGEELAVLVQDEATGKWEVVGGTDGGRRRLLSASTCANGVCSAKVAHFSRYTVAKVTIGGNSNPGYSEKEKNVDDEADGSKIPVMFVYVGVALLGFVVAAAIFAAVRIKRERVFNATTDAYAVKNVAAPPAGLAMDEQIYSNPTSPTSDGAGGADLVFHKSSKLPRLSLDDAATNAARSEHYDAEAAFDAAHDDDSTPLVTPEMGLFGGITTPSHRSKAIYVSTPKSAITPKSMLSALWNMKTPKSSANRQMDSFDEV